MLPIHVAETREQAFKDVEFGLLNWNNEYFHTTLGHPAFKLSDNTRELAERMTTFGAPVIGSPDDLLARIEQLQNVSGGFGCVLGLAHEWASPEATRKSYELIARYVMPEVQDLTSWVKRSGDWTRNNVGTLNAGRRSRDHQGDRREQGRRRPPAVDAGGGRARSLRRPERAETVAPRHCRAHRQSACARALAVAIEPARMAQASSPARSFERVQAAC